MASNTKSNLHARSNSLPSRPHPLILECNDHLDRLRSSQETSSSSSYLTCKLQGLQDLHQCVGKMMQLPLTQEALQHESQDELLDGSLRLLDACTSAKDSLLHTKECVRELRSVMRRKRGSSGEIELKSEVKKFLSSRKVVKKAISKTLENLKGCNISSSNKENQTVALLSNVEEVTLSTFQALMQFISGTTQMKSSNWLLISKLMQNKKVACSQLAEESEFAQLDEALQSCVFDQTNMNKLQNQLEKVESVINDLEEGLEFMFRRLIKTRVVLLNILNH